MKLKLTNKILIPLLGLILIGFMSLILCTKGEPGEYKNSQVCIKKSNKVVKKIDIRQLKQECEIDLGTNIVCVTKSGVYMKKATCPDKLCVHNGTIDKPGQSIVCLPNKLMVEIIGNKKDVDAVAGAR